MKTLHRLWLHWHYSFEMTNAYLCAQMGEMDCCANHESAAYQVERKLAILDIQP